MRRLVMVALALLASWSARAPAQSLRVAETPEELERRAVADSNDAAAHYNAALGWWSRNRYDRADSALVRATALDPSFAMAWLARGIVQNRNERYWGLVRRGGDSAVAAELRLRTGYVRKAFLVDPFVDVRVLGTVTQRGYRSTDFTRGIEHVVQGEYEEAYRRFETVLAQESRRGLDSVPEILLWLHSLAAARSGHLPEAMADNEAMLRVSTARERADSVRAVPLETNEYRYMLAALHQRAGQHADAVRRYRDVLEHDIGNYMAHVQLARIYESAGDLATAVTERERAVEVNPDDPTLLLDLGTTLARANRWDEAAEALERATAAAPRDARGFYRLGIVRQQLGRRAEARDAFERFLQLAPSRLAPAIADARTRLGQVGP